MIRFAPVAFVFLAACSSTPPCENDTMAFVMSQEFVERELRSPSTADFPMITDDGVYVIPSGGEPGTCTFKVLAYVDAQNGFGATVRQNYTATVSPDANETDWTLVDLTLY